MGSFANSLHVKSTRGDEVAQSISAILKSEGWQPTQKLPDRRDLDSPLRALHVSAPAGGWVSVLDSDLPGAHSLTATLAKRLKTHAIFCFVNDSDSWSYLLVAPDGTLSEFDSAEGEDDGDDGDEHMVQASVAIEKVQALMQDGGIQQRIQQIQQQMTADAPPEIRAAEERMRSGRATAADMQQYQTYAMQHMPKYMNEMKSLLAGIMGMSAAPAKKSSAPHKLDRAQRAAQRERLAALRPILAAGVTDEQAEEVFKKRAVFAEEILAEFLPLIGLSADYAYASYVYSQEATGKPLAAGGDPFAHGLRFERSGRS